MPVVYGPEVPVDVLVNQTLIKFIDSQQPPALPDIDQIVAKALEPMSQRIQFLGVENQRLLTGLQSQQDQSKLAPEIDYEKLAKSILPSLRANIEGHVKAIYEETRAIASK
jgi:hypothetical protein